MLKFMRFLKKFNKKWFALSFDLIAISLAWHCAYLLRYSTLHFPEKFYTLNTLWAFICLGIIQSICYFFFKVYRGVWYYSSINDVARIIKAVLLAIVIAIPVFYFTSLLNYIPRSILPLYAVCLSSFLCAARLITRTYFEHALYHNKENKLQRVLIIGAGQAGANLIRELSRLNNYYLIGLADDDISKLGTDIYGVRVLGNIIDVPMIVNNHKADIVFIAIPSAKSAEMRHIVKYCELSNIAFRTLPCLSDLITNHIEVNILRAVNIADLLGRDQVELSWDKITNIIKNKKIVITGGGGSIGSELCRQIMQLNPQSLLIIDNSEFNLYNIEQEIKEQWPNLDLKISLLSITDATGINFLFNEFKPQIVFHAAAYKHVPLLEQQIRIAVENNIFGTQILAEASINNNVEKFILISSDKAVNPVNIMGVTKRIAEIFCQNINTYAKTQFITVRFGNVLGSTGSVIPLFQKQIQTNQPLTLTHPDMKRYFMTIIEACQLILQATTNGNGGEIFILNMGEPIKILYLAEQMIKLSGKELYKDATIKYIGLRPGEKLFEELFHESEQIMQTQHEKLLIAQTRHFDWQELMVIFKLLRNACLENNNAEIYVLLKNLVPEFNNSVINSVTSQEKVTLYEDDIVFNK